MDCASVKPKQTAKIAQKLLASPAGSPYVQLTWFRVKEVDDFMRVSLLLGIFAMTASTVAHAGGSTALSYPETRKLDVIEEQFGVKVAIPFAGLKMMCASIRRWPNGWRGRTRFPVLTCPTFLVVMRSRRG